MPADSPARHSYWSIAIGLSTLLALVLSPLVGAICDYSGRKKTYLLATSILCALSTSLLAFELSALAHAGLMPRFDACALCGGEPGERPRDGEVREHEDGRDQHRERDEAHRPDAPDHAAGRDEVDGVAQRAAGHERAAEHRRRRVAG